MASEYYSDEEIEKIKNNQFQKPHVVILGAGASRAAFPNGDKNGKKLPIMDDLISVLDLDQVVVDQIEEYGGKNFEDIYSHFYLSENEEVKLALEKATYSYFDGLEIDSKPTLYDHLLLSLTEKDVVATFNWDPLLVQAYRRNLGHIKLPRLIFLHGNVAIGSCEKHRILSPKEFICNECKTPIIPSRLLYPVTQKNYTEDTFIKQQWDELARFMGYSFMITIFGYGAPSTDVEAIELMKNAWGDVHDRSMEQTEIIDIKQEDELTKVWEPFIHTHHYDVEQSFYDSLIAKHPRKTAKAHYYRYWEPKFFDDNTIPRDLDFPHLWDWFISQDMKEITFRET